VSLSVKDISYNKAQSKGKNVNETYIDDIKTESDNKAHIEENKTGMGR
jgi:hypothetical protein